MPALHAAIIVEYETLSPANDAFVTIDGPSNADAGQLATVAQHPNSSISAPGGFNDYTTLKNGVTGVPSNAAGLGILHSSTTNDLLYYYDLGSSQNIRQINAYSSNSDFRAPITLSIWGSNNPNSILAGGATGTSSGATTITALKTAGWSQIVGAGSPTVSNREAGMQVTDSTDSLGAYRYLLFSHGPNNAGANTSSYIREIDVYTGGAPIGFDVPISNASFEMGVSAGTIAGWTKSGGGGTAIFNEGFGSSTNLPSPEGINSLGLRANTVGNSVVLTQTLGTLTDLGTYTLSFFVADRVAERWLNYQVELLSGSDVLISENSATNSALRPFNGSTDFLSDIQFGAEGDWLNVVLSGMTTEDMIGQSLTIRFTSTAQSNDNGTHFDFALDNVQLSFILVPEPSTFALAILGLLVPGAVAARQRRRASKQ